MPLSHIALRTRDLGETRRFYRDLLGLREAFTHPGMLFLESPGGRDLLNFVEVRKPIDPERLHPRAVRGLKRAVKALHRVPRP